MGSVEHILYEHELQLARIWKRIAEIERDKNLFLTGKMTDEEICKKYNLSQQTRMEE